MMMLALILGAGACGNSDPEPDLQSANADRQSLTPFAGSGACQDCHAAEYANWSASNHAQAERPLDAALDAQAFATAPGARWNGKFTVSARGLQGEGLFEVSRVIGVEPLRQYLVERESGRVQVLQASYDPARGEWFDVFGSDGRQPGEWGHWTGRGMNWNSRCASCHNTAFDKGYSLAGDSYASTMAEMGVGCEACHGPLADHASAAEAGEDPSASPDSLGDRQILDTCASCHSLRTELTGRFVPGEAFEDHYQLAVVDESERYFADGQVLEENYVFGSFAGSAMYEAGVVCRDCHDPHSDALMVPGNALCMRCHATPELNAPVIDPEPHMGHAAAAPGGNCVDCHMPQTTYMQRHPRRDHGFTIPDPALTIEEGVPNACNRCHQEQTPEWALAHATAWYGAIAERDSQQRARWIAAARRGDPAALPALMEAARREPSAYWRAVAVGLLDHWLTDPAVRTALIAALSDPDPLVRGRALESLEPAAQQADAMTVAAINPLLRDPTRGVRIAAAWALRGISAGSAALGELRRSLSFNADQPGGRVQWAMYDMARNDSKSALEHLHKAVAWDPTSAAVHQYRAVILSELGRAPEAVAELEHAVELEPESARYHYLLGLSYHEIGQDERMIASLKQALELDPGFARAWYNLGLALNAGGDPEAGIEALLAGEAADPSDPQIPYARATILLNRGDPEGALEAVTRALDIQPVYPQARQLRARILHEFRSASSIN